MFRTRIRTAILTIATTLGIAGVALIPTAAQAQWHTICTAGHCITHTNYTIGGVDPCTGIKANYDKAYETLLEDLQSKAEELNKVHPGMTQAEAQAQIEADEAQVHAAGIAAFEWGCDAAMHSSPGSAVKTRVGAINVRLRATASRRVHRPTLTRSLAVR